jgi:deoxyribonuclease V
MRLRFPKHRLNSRLFLMSESLKELASEQSRLSKRLVLRDGFERVRLVAGADQAFIGKNIISSVVLCSYDTLEPVEKVHATIESSFPYIPTFLSYREAPSIVSAWEKLKVKPDVLLIDGQGIAHPRGMGLASHVSVILDVPTIGVAKSRLFGDHRTPVTAMKPEKLICGKGQIGWVLRTKSGCRPIFISPGNKVSLGSSLEIVLGSMRNHKLPEPLRLAHIHAKETKERIGFGSRKAQ